MPSLTLSSDASETAPLPGKLGRCADSEEVEPLETSNGLKTKTVSETTSCNDVPVLRRAAMDYLARREHSHFELIQKLGKKFPDANTQILASVVQTLEMENLQSDERFVESYVRYRINRGFAYLHIKADLAARRVSDSLINKHLVADDEQWLQMAEQVISKKLRGQPSLEFGSKIHKKLVRFLESRGFSSLVIRKTLEKHLL